MMMATAKYRRGAVLRSSPQASFFSMNDNGGIDTDQPHHHQHHHHHHHHLHHNQDDDDDLSEWINRYNAIYAGDNVNFKPYSKRELQYYLDYDPMVGFRIAVSLGMLILLFTIFVLYKTHCHAKKNRRLIQNAQNAQSAQITPGTPSMVSPV